MQILSSLTALVRSLPQSGFHALDAIYESIRTLFSGDRETRRSVAFSVAMIALSAKMAKADGVVSPAEVAAFRQIFDVPPEELRNVFRLYDIAKKDIAGFDAYARRMTTLCGDPGDDCRLLGDILDGLFHIAKSDGVVHQRELDVLERIADIFGVSPADFATILRRHVHTGRKGAYAVLGVEPDAPPEVVRARYLQLVKENHPDRLAARGVPDEFMAIGLERIKAINAAYDEVARAVAT